MPTSYLTAEEKIGMSENCAILAESQAADDAGDEQAAWEWLAMAELPAHSLKSLKRRRGADFIRKMGFRTEAAEREYGKNWLDQ